MGQHKAIRKSQSFGWDNTHSEHATPIPIVGFDYELIFNLLDGVVSEDHTDVDDRPSLLEILSPRELQHAYAVAQKILRASSPGVRATRAAWRNPEKRQKWIAAIRRAAQNPAVQRKKAVSLRRSWQTRDRLPMREMMLRLWRDRGAELIAAMRRVIDTPEHRWGISKRNRALWANPAFREKVLAKLRSPEFRHQTSLNSQRYYQNHPEARNRAAEIARSWWRDPAYRRRNLNARKLAAARALRAQTPLARAMRAAWRDPESRQRRLESLRRAAQKPEVKLKRAASLRRYWQTHDRQPLRDVMCRLWRKRRSELVAKLTASARRPEFRQRVAENSRARWRDPERRQKALTRLHSPEWRARASLATRRYFATHPAAREQSAQRARAMWRDHDYRRRRRQTISAKKLCVAKREVSPGGGPAKQVNSPGL